MSGPEKPNTGMSAEGSTFSTTLHLLSPRLQNWIRNTSDRNQLRRFACACVRALFAHCPQVPPTAEQTVELAERYCRNEATAEQLETTYAALSPIVRDAYERVWIAQRELDADRGTLEDVLARDLAHRALVAARGCVLRSAPVAAAEAIYEISTVLGRLKVHEIQNHLLARADRLLDRQAPWALEREDELLQTYWNDLPRPFAVRLQQASDGALRRFACECATAALEASRKETTVLGVNVNFGPLLHTIDVSRRAALGQVSPSELDAICEGGAEQVQSWYRREDDCRYRDPQNTGPIRAAGLMARLADCVHSCAEPSARMAAVKCVRLALPLLGDIDPIATVQPLAEQYLGPPPAE